MVEQSVCGNAAGNYAQPKSMPDKTVPHMRRKRLQMKRPSENFKTSFEAYVFRTASIRSTALFHFAFQRAVACRVHLFQRDEFQARAVDASSAGLLVFGAVEDVPQCESAVWLRTSVRRML